jgi:hypothetical protein
MSVSLQVLFDHSRLPKLAQWQQQLDEAGTDLRLQPLDPDEHTGFWPATFGHDGAAGFEFDLGSSEEAFDSIPEPAGTFDAVATFTVGASGTELRSAMLAAGALCSLTGGTLLDGATGEWKSAEEVLTEARAVPGGDTPADPLTATGRPRRTMPSKAAVLRQWNDAFPELVPVGRHMLFRRVGPHGAVLEGVVLEWMHGEYRPYSLLHCLAHPQEVIHLTHARQLVHDRSGTPESVNARQHRSRFGEAAAQVRRRSALGFPAAPTAESILAGFEHDASEQRNFVGPALAIQNLLVLTSLYARDDLLQGYVHAARAMEPSATDGSVASFDKAFELVASRQALEATVAAEVARHHVEHVPQA